MFLDPGGLFMLVVLVGVAGYVAKNLMLSYFRLSQAERPKGNQSVEMEERLRKIEAATSSLLVDVSNIKEKQRFMTRLQAGAARRETDPAEQRSEGELSPMVTQSIPAVPRVGSPRI